MLFWKKKNDATDIESPEEAGFQQLAGKIPQSTVKKTQSKIKTKKAVVPKKKGASKAKVKSAGYVIDRNLKDRFLSNVKKEKNHWRWLGSFTDDGYGQMWVAENKVVKTHRLSFEIHRKKLGSGERLRNLCGDKQCINPAHWEIIKKESVRTKNIKKVKPTRKIATKKKKAGK